MFLATVFVRDGAVNAVRRSEATQPVVSNGMKLYTITEVAELLKISRTSCYKLVYSGDLAVHRPLRDAERLGDVGAAVDRPGNVLPMVAVALACGKGLGLAGCRRGPDGTVAGDQAVHRILAAPLCRRFPCLCRVTFDW